MPSPRRSVAVVAVLLATSLVLVATAPLAAAHGNQLAVDAQRSADGTVTVETAFAVTDAWIVVHASANDTSGRTLGRTALDANSVRTDASVELADAAWRDWDGARTVTVALHRDDGDGSFDPADDPVLSTAAGQRVVERVTVQRADAGAYVGTRGFHPLETDGTITVRHAVIPADGYLVVQNGSTDGRVGGVTALSAGSHANVTVDVADAFLRAQGQRGAVTAVLYRDDGDGSFDPAADTPITAGGAPVASTVPVHVNASALATATPTATPATGTGDHDDDHGDHDHDDGDPDDGDHDHDDGDHDHDDGDHDHDETAGTATPAPTPTATPTVTPAGEPTTTGATGATGPGFGVAATLVALLVALVVAARRR